MNPHSHTRGRDVAHALRGHEKTNKRSFLCSQHCADK
jgi:hypothetical protein